MLAYKWWHTEISFWVYFTTTQDNQSGFPKTKYSFPPKAPNHSFTFYHYIELTLCYTVIQHTQK